MILLLGFTLTLSSCSSAEKVLSRTEQCKQDYNEARQLINDEDYFDARENLNSILANCSGTGFMEEAQFQLAESHFLADEWIEAYGEYNIFLNHYPSSPSAPLAFYRKGLSAWSHDYVPGRDEAYTQDALDAFDEFLRVYPQNPKADSANYYVQNLRERLAKREMATAILYLKMREPQATAIYLQDFLKTFPDSKLYPQALALLVESYTRLDQFEQAQEYLTLMSQKLDAAQYQSQIASLNEDLMERKLEYNSDLEDARKQKLKKAQASP